jgi:hypothetical protein
MYTHNASAASAFTNYPGITKVTSVNPENPNSVRSWTPDLPSEFLLPWLTSFAPGSSYQVALSANANVVQQGTYPGSSVRPVIGPYAFLSMPANSLPLNIKTATVINSVGATVALKDVLGIAWTVNIVGGAANNSWNYFDKTLVDTTLESTIFTTFVPGSSYYIQVGSNFTINIPRRNGYLITNDARFITTNDGRYLVVNQST